MRFEAPARHGVLSEAQCLLPLYIEVESPAVTGRMRNLNVFDVYSRLPHYLCDLPQNSRTIRYGDHQF